MHRQLLARLRRHARDQGPRGRDRVRRGRRHHRHERQGLHRRDRRALVLQRRLRPARDRRRGRRAAHAPARLLELRGVHDRGHAAGRRSTDLAGPDPERGRLPRLGRLRRDRHRDEARAALLGRGGQAQQDALVSREHSYHGMHAMGTSLTGMPAMRNGYGGEPFINEVVHVPALDVEAVARLFDQRRDEIAAFVGEPVIGAGGVYPRRTATGARSRRACAAARHPAHRRRGHHGVRADRAGCGARSATASSRT